MGVYKSLEIEILIFLVERFDLKISKLKILWKQKDTYILDALEVS